MFFKIEDALISAEVVSRQYLLRFPFTGGWQVKATLETPRCRGVIAGEWMFLNTANPLNVETYSFQVLQYTEQAKISDGLPCFLRRQDAIAFLDNVIFAGEVIRYQNWQPAVYDLSSPTKTVYTKTEGDYDRARSRIDSALVIEKTRHQDNLLSRPRQCWRPSKDQDNFRYYE